MKSRWTDLPAIFLAGFATLLFEVTVTKIFEFSLWANYAYLVISTAMFGLGLSGVILIRWPNLLRIRDGRFLPACAALVAVTIVGAFFTLNDVPIHLPDAPGGWGREFLNIACVFCVLGLPFVFFGLVMSFVMEHRGRRANVYYFADLVGAGLGAFALVWLIPLLEPQGLVVVSAMTSLGAAALFLFGPGAGSMRRMAGLAGLAAAAAGILYAAPRAAPFAPLAVHAHKRHYNREAAAGKLEKSGWSALSRVDIAPMGRDLKRVWIAGGVNESSILRFDGNYDRARAQRDRVIAEATVVTDAQVLPHLLKTDHTVCVIGTSGGADSLQALRMGARKVTGIEMDPTIVRFVTEDYRNFDGGLFTDGTNSEIVVDEGRSYLRRAGRSFDVIEQVNNFTPVAFQNGALNLSETYLLTVESFRDFYDHLNPDGLLAISRYGSVRLLSIAVEMFRRMGMKPEEYARHLFVCEGPNWVMNTFMMKKSAFTPEEIDRLFAFFRAGSGNRSVLYAPYRTADLPDLEHNLYYKLATAADPSVYWRQCCFDFSPTTDSRPFFNHMHILGVRDTRRDQMDLLPGETRHVERHNVLGHLVPAGDLPPLLILVESLLLSSVFFGLPLWTKRELRAALRADRRAIGYFACLGAGFIFVEICLIQRLVLFLGAPVYSIATVLSSLLVFAGLGSLASGLLRPTLPTLRLLLGAVAASILVLHFGMGALTNHFLGSPLPVRIVVALLFTGGAGFLMGMPMPTGIRFLKEAGSPIIPWAWATNGFFSVVGSAVSVLLASSFGFPVVFIAAAILYASGSFWLRPLARRSNRAGNVEC